MEGVLTPPRRGLLARLRLWLAGTSHENDRSQPLEDAALALRRHGDAILRLAFSYLHRRDEAEDVLQDTLLQYLQKAPPFSSAEHEKAWFIQVTLNACRDLLRFWARRPTVPLEELTAQAVPESEDRGVLEAVLSLPQKYRDTVYLHYYEGYSAPEIGALLGRNTNTVYTLLNRARAMLREKLGGDEDG